MTIGLDAGVVFALAFVPGYAFVATGIGLGLAIPLVLVTGYEAEVGAGVVEAIAVDVVYDVVRPSIQEQAVHVRVLACAIDLDVGRGVTAGGEMPFVLEEGRVVGIVDQRGLAAREGDMGCHARSFLS